MAWNGSDGAQTPKIETVRKDPAIGKASIAGVLVVVIGGLVAYFMMGGRDQAVSEDTKSSSSAPIAEKTPAKSKNIEIIPSTEKLPMPKLSGERIEKRNAVPAPQSLEKMEEQAKILIKKRRPAFTNGVEQLIALATPAAPGFKVPPLPHITDESVASELKAAMSHVIKAEEDDTEDVLEKKLVVAAAKEEFSELHLNEGYGFVEYVNALRDQANDDADFMGEANRLADELYHDSAVTDEEYIKYRDQLNEKLRQRGLPEIEN